MKKLLLYLFTAVVLLGADAANDVVLSQRKADNSGFIQRNVAPVSFGLMLFDTNKVPTSDADITFNGLELQSKGYKGALTTLTYASTTDIVMTANLNTVSLTGDITFTTSAKAAGQYVTVRIVCDGTNRTLAFPGTWRWLGSVAPSTMIAGKVGELYLTCYGATDADITAKWVSEL